MKRNVYSYFYEKKKRPEKRAEISERFACVIVCALAVSLSLICAAGWLL